MWNNFSSWAWFSVTICAVWCVLWTTSWFAQTVREAVLERPLRDLHLASTSLPRDGIRARVFYRRRSSESVVVLEAMFSCHVTLLTHMLLCMQHTRSTSAVLARVCAEISIPLTPTRNCSVKSLHSLPRTIVQIMPQVLFSRPQIILEVQIMLCRVLPCVLISSLTITSKSWRSKLLRRLSPRHLAAAQAQRASLRVSSAGVGLTLVSNKDF